MPDNLPIEENHSRTLSDRFSLCRATSLRHCAPLAIEDYGLQATADSSPAKWHLAHTSWFFETFILKPYARHYRLFDPQFEYLFNSYYNGVGAQFPRPQRGLLSRPTVEQIQCYRDYIDAAIVSLLEDTHHPHYTTITERVELGLHHEQQHQELFFTDIKLNFHHNPLLPHYQSLQGDWLQSPQAAPCHWIDFAGGITGIGINAQENTFSFDNENPHHRVWLEPFQLASRPVTNGEFLAFIEDKGYQQAALWLADGWTHAQQHGWKQPLYWRQLDGQWFEFTLYGLQPLDLSRTACHLSGYEADAYARWASARLPTEEEWERAANQTTAAAHSGAVHNSHFADQSHFHPQAAAQESGLQQMLGTVWEWTASAYTPYSGYQPAAGAIGEYNGKFMANQLVLRGGSCVSERHHIRTSYRNFFYPPDRWQFSGIRLAKNGVCR